MHARYPRCLYTAAQVRELDRRAIDDHGIDGYRLMRRAAAAAFQCLRQRWPEAQRLAVFCGGGNNGGDGLVVAQLAHDAGLEVQVGLQRDPADLHGAAASAWSDWAARGGAAQGFDELATQTADVVVDAVLGTGLDRPVAGAAATAIERMRHAQRPVLALDIPSGLDADSGAIRGDAVVADATVTFIGAKRGLYTGRAPDLTGPVCLETLEVPPAVYQGLGAATETIDTTGAIAQCPRRRPGAHKGDAGHVVVAGGDAGFAGAPRMAGEAALRCGAGRVSVATRAAHAPVLAASRPELMAHPVEAPAVELAPLLARADAVALGPGLGRHAWGAAMLDAALAEPRRLVLDADALNGLAERGDWSLGEAVLTPHPGEAARLLATSTQAVQDDRFAAAEALRDRTGSVVVLKGAGTIVAAPGTTTRLLPGARPAMASGGMGDVLTGIIAALMAQGMAATDAACSGAALHARAADSEAPRVGAYGLVATDLMGSLGRLRSDVTDG